MKIDVEEIGPCSKQLKIEVPQELYLKEEDNAYRELGKKAKIPGFRAGKIPRKQLEKLYSANIENDVLNRVIPEAYYKAIEEKKLKPVSSPRLDNISHEKGSPITFTATIDVVPLFEINNYEGMEFPKKIVKITEEDVEIELEYIKERFVTYDEITDRPAKEGDLIMTDFKGYLDGAPFKGAESKNYPLLIGSNSLMEEFEKGFIGMNANDEKEISITYPGDYINKELSGKKVLFKVKVNEIKIKKLPKITDKLIKEQLGKEQTVDELKKEIKERHESLEKSAADASLREDILSKLIELNPIEIPQALIEDQINFMAENFKQRMKLQGIKEDDSKIDREKFREDATKIMKGELIQHKISEASKIEIDSKEIEEGLEKLAKEKKVAKEKLKISMQKDKSYNTFVSNLQRKKTMDFVISKINVKEVFIDRKELNPEQQV